MALVMGQRVVLHKPRWVLKDWRKLKRQCTACSGAGTQLDEAVESGVKLCRGCNGWGSVWEWQGPEK